MHSDVRLLSWRTHRAGWTNPRQKDERAHCRLAHGLLDPIHSLDADEGQAKGCLVDESVESCDGLDIMLEQRGRSGDHNAGMCVALLATVGNLEHVHDEVIQRLAWIMSVGWRWGWT